MFILPFNEYLNEEDKNSLVFAKSIRARLCGLLLLRPYLYNIVLKALTMPVRYTAAEKLGVIVNNTVLAVALSAGRETWLAAIWIGEFFI
jgi:hypothetical protein